MKRMGIVSILVLLLTSILVLPVLAAQQQTAAVQKTGIQSILEPAKLSTAQVSGYLPKLGGLLLILVVGSLLALGIAGLAGLILKTIQLEKGAKKINIPEILKKGGIGLPLSDLITEIIFFVLIVATLITALEFYGVGTAGLTSPILAYVPQVISAVFILILGILVAILISGIIKLVGGNVKIAQSDTLGNIAKYAIIVVASWTALKELGIKIIQTDTSKDIVLAGILLAVVLGAKERIGKLLDKIFKG